MSLDDFIKKNNIRLPKPKEQEYKTFDVFKHGINVDRQFLDTLKGKEYLTSTHIKFFTNLFQHYYDRDKQVCGYFHQILLLDPYFFSDFMPRSTVQIQFQQETPYMDLSHPQTNQYEADIQLAIQLSSQNHQTSMQPDIQIITVEQSTVEQQVNEKNDSQVEGSKEQVLDDKNSNIEEDKAQNLINPSVEQVKPQQDIQGSKEVQQDLQVSKHDSQQILIEQTQELKSKEEDKIETDSIPKEEPQMPIQVLQQGKIQTANQQNQELPEQNQEHASTTQEDNIQIDIISSQRKEPLMSVQLTQQDKIETIDHENEISVQPEIELIEGNGITLQGVEVETNDLEHDYSAIADRLQFWNNFYKCSSQNPITEKDYTYIPINIQNDHWICVIIFNQFNQFQYLDSMNGVQGQIIDGIQKILSYASDQRQWEMIEGSPQQNNGYDCGAFCIMAYYKLVKSDPKVPIKYNDYNASSVELFRRKLIKLAVIAGQTDNLSPEIIDLILK